MGRSSTKTEGLDESLDNLDSTIDKYISEIKEKKFSYDEFIKKCKSIKYQNKGDLGINFYVYHWYDKDEARKNQTNLITDVGYDNYKDIELTNLHDVDFENNGSEIYKEAIANQLDSFLTSVNNELGRIDKDYTKIKEELTKISDNLAEIKLPNVNLSQDYMEIANKFDNIRKKINGVI